MTIQHLNTRGAEPVPQYMDALAYANEIRLKRVAIKREIEAGQLAIPDLLEEIPLELETMTVGQLLRSQFRWGKKRTRALCSHLCINESRQLRDLTMRQKRLIAGAVQ